MGRKCKHEDTYNLIVDKAKKFDNELILRRAILISTCQKCERKLNEYCAGGVIWPENEMMR